MSIRSYGSRRARTLAKGDDRYLVAELRDKALDVLRRLDRGDSPAALRAAGYQIHRLTGNLKGYHAIAISGSHRVIFRFEDGDFYRVDVLDYHKS